jgi:signal transduction histidine kinase
MKLRILLPLLALVLLSTAVVGWYADHILERVLLAQDRGERELDHARVAAALDLQLERLSGTARTYAQWSATAAFLDLPESAYAENFSDERLRNLQVDLIVLLRADGAEALRVQSRKIQELPAFPQAEALWVHKDGAAARRGLWQEPEGWWLVAAEQIPGEDGSPKGTLIAGIRLNGASLRELAQLSQLDLGIGVDPNPGAPPEIDDPRSLSWVLLPSLQEEPLSIEVSRERPLMRWRGPLVGGMVGLTALSGLLWVALAMFLLERYLYRPLQNLDQRIRAAAPQLLLPSPDPEPVQNLTGTASALLVATLAARETSARQQRRLFSLLDGLPLPVAIKDNRRVYTLVSRHYAELFGRSSLGVEGKRDEALLPAALADELRVEDEGLLRYSLEAEPVERNFRGRPLLFTKIPLRESGGQVTGLLVVAEDRSLLRSAENSASLRLDLLERLREELRLPLAGLLASLQTEYVPTPEQAEAILDHVDDLLELARIGAQAPTLEHRPLPLLDCLHDQVARCQEQARAKGLSLRLEVGDSCPPEVVGDEQQLLRLFKGLLRSAIASSGPGTLEISVDAAAEPIHPVWLRFRLRDAGPPLREEEQRRLLLPFSPEPRPGGAGAALAAALATAMGGSLELRTDSRANVWLLSIPFTARMAPRPTTRPLRIMVVDDSPVNLAAAERILGRVGHRTCCTTRTSEAREKIADMEMLLVDLQLPDQAGLQLVRELRQAGWNGPVLGLSSSGRLEDIDQAQRAGVNVLVPRPLAAARLHAAIETALREIS